MADSSPSQSQSYLAMAKGDVEAIGAHCQMEYCHILDFLPFECQSCNKTFCLDHRSETAHKCTHEGAWARERAARENAGNQIGGATPKPSLNTHGQCREVSCKTLINTPLMPPNECSSCNRSYCLKHRMPEDHDCKNVPRGGIGRAASARQQTMTALAKIKLWADNKRKEDEKRRNSSKKFGLFGLGKLPSAVSTATADLNILKCSAKGDAKIPQEKRIYLHVEASADTTKAKFPTGKFFYNKEWTVGRVLDVAAKALQVENVNNRGGGEEDKLRIFHVESGGLLRFSEKIGGPCANGNTIVLLRGVGSGEAPDLIDL